MSESKYAEDLALAHLLADIADAISLDRYQSLDLVITTKPDNTPVTDADRAVETAIREALATHRPNCLLYTSPSPRDGATSRMPSSA